MRELKESTKGLYDGGTGLIEEHVRRDADTPSADKESVAASPHHFTRHLRDEVEGGTPMVSEDAAIIRLLQRYSRKPMLSASFAPRISGGAS